MIGPSPSPGELEHLYRVRFSHHREYRNRVWQVLATRYFSHWIEPTASVLDLGCGYCEFINNVAAARKYGMDLNPDATRHAAAGVTVFSQDCSEPWPVPEGSLDVVFTSNFFEHLSTEAHIERTMQHARRALRPGGVLIAMGPNITYLPESYWDFSDHHVALTESSLAQALRTCGFAVEIVAAKFLPYTMSNKRNYPIVALRVYLRLPLIWRVFGKQFLVVARKRAHRESSTGESR